AGLSEARRLDRLELGLLDLGLPGCSGMDALVKFRKAVPNARVGVISADGDGERGRGALGEGAASYVPKTLRPKAMVDALRTILDGGTYTPPAAAAQP